MKNWLCYDFFFFKFEIKMIIKFGIRGQNFEKSQNSKIKIKILSKELNFELSIKIYDEEKNLKL